MALKRIVGVLAALVLSLFSARAEECYRLLSPDGNLAVKICVGEELCYSVAYRGVEVLTSSPLALCLTDGACWGPRAQVKRAENQTCHKTIQSPFYRDAEIEEHYNALTLQMKGDWSVEFRAYDDGVAYRFGYRGSKPRQIEQEQVEYRFGADHTVITPYVARGEEGDFESQFNNSFENTYTVAPLSQMNPKRLSFLPLVVRVGEVNCCLTESDLNNYPGLYLLKGVHPHSLKGHFAPYPKREVQGGRNGAQLFVEQREAYIARLDGARTLPWRIAVVGDDVTLASSRLSYLLAEPSRIEDTSWIQPGKVAWDWWNDWNLEGVDFPTGVNTETYKYYIDFAARQGVEYVILDEGWSVAEAVDLMQVVPSIDLAELIAYGQERGVGIILWACYWAFDRDMEQVCSHYAQMGVKGFKIDFMDRDDQKMTAFNHRAAEVAARHHLLLDLHGSHKPAGLHRTWPNVLNFEGVYGQENAKWAGPEWNQPLYNVQIPFIRQVAGPMDYTQGAMRNTVRAGYYPNYSEPMSQGTRAHQLGLYVVLDSPLNMLCDSPTNYEKEPESTAFIAQIPTVWDETRILQGELGEYIITARRKGECWYVGGITNWTPRDVEIDLSALCGEATVTMTLFRDGVNAYRKASDYRREELTHDTRRPLKIHLAPGGGFACCIE